eukprot:TRINITY_DN4659_c0_g3_i1.p1 TRINITY_DN4659_c0_g3~~TRINITY_DN4659_c0_g3_i1.p1  ORF type:complete len:412 (+),score=74.21 TRINITY_DN4659_c0_g3_i1:53-1288(+)
MEVAAKPIFAARLMPCGQPVKKASCRVVVGSHRGISARSHNALVGKVPFVASRLRPRRAAATGFGGSLPSAKWESKWEAVHRRGVSTTSAAGFSNAGLDSGDGVSVSMAGVAEALERARSQAAAMGYNSEDAYEPWMLIDGAQQAFVLLHDTCGDGGVAVALAAVLMRIMTLPWNLRSLQKQSDRLVLFPAWQRIAQALQAAQRQRGGADGSGPAGAQKAEADLIRLGAQLKDFTQTTNFSPVQGMGYQFFCMLPLQILGYCALSGIMGHPDAFRGVVSSPTLWLGSLVLADPTGALPVLSACAMLMNVEINSPPPVDGKEETAIYFKFVMRGAILCFVPLTSLLPSAMVLWIGSNAGYTALSTWVFRRWYWTPPKIESRWAVDAVTPAASPLAFAPPAPPPPPVRPRPKK